MSQGSLRSTLIHLRLPFSLFLAPVFLFALGETPQVIAWKACWAFLILHLLLFPASNAYNSYYDKDEGSIGLIEKPPPTSRSLLIAALMLDLLALAVAWFAQLGSFFMLYLLLYGFVSKAYSHPAVRLKKYPIVSLMVVSVFQGFYTFLASYQVISQADMSALLSASVVIPAILSSVNLLAVYPLTQVYQHQEDQKHGDLTYSRLVGIRGTFLHAGVFFFVSFAGFGYWYATSGRIERWFLFSAFMTPVLIYFLYWRQKTIKNEAEASYQHTMRMNILASTCLNIFFLLLCALSGGLG